LEVRKADIAIVVGIPKQLELGTCRG